MHRFTTRLLRSVVSVAGVALALSAFSGCSLFYDLNATQCAVDSDCAALGPEFAGTTCENRVCVAPISNAGGGGGDAGASGDQGNGASSGSGGKSSTGGKSGGGSGGSGGSAGGTVVPVCTTNADCIVNDVPAICKKDATGTASCVPLISTECPVLLPTNNTLTLLKTGTPIILGGYANMTNTATPHDSLAVINWDLAFDEFNSNTSGHLPSLDSKLHPVLDLVCQGTASDITPSLTHLTEDIGTPGILTTLSTDKLLTAYNFTQTSDYTDAHFPSVLFVSTGSADLKLANLADGGLVWHMLGDPRTLAATMVALLKRIEPYVNGQRASLCASQGASCKDNPSKTPMRVTLVYNDQATMYDLNTVMTSPDSAHPEVDLSFNNATTGASVNASGMDELSAIDQLPGTGNGAFRDVEIDSAQTKTTPDVSKAIADLEQYPPHVILAVATSEFPQTVMPAVEGVWGMAGTPSEGMQKPFYIASQLLYNTSQLQSAARNLGLNTRLVGVNYAEAQDTHSKQLYNSYEARLQQSYSGSLTYAGTENYYDGAYSMLYALAAAARPSPDGAALASALGARVFSVASGATSVDIGPNPIAMGSVLNLAPNTYRMSLWGTMGAPNFDYASGTRVSTTSAWCIEPGTSDWVYQADGLIYDPKNQVFNDPPATVPATAKPACISMY